LLQQLVVTETDTVLQRKISREFNRFYARQGDATGVCFSFSKPTEKDRWLVTKLLDIITLGADASHYLKEEEEEDTTIVRIATVDGKCAGIIAFDVHRSVLGGVVLNLKALVSSSSLPQKVKAKGFYKFGGFGKVAMKMAMDVVRANTPPNAPGFVIAETTNWPKTQKFYDGFFLPGPRAWSSEDAPEASAPDGAQLALRTLELFGQPGYFPVNTHLLPRRSKPLERSSSILDNIFDAAAEEE
jgi:hypothetical protein